MTVPIYHTPWELAKVLLLCTAIAVGICYLLDYIGVWVFP